MDWYITSHDMSFSGDLIRLFNLRVLHFLFIVMVRNGFGKEMVEFITEFIQIKVHVQSSDIERFRFSEMHVNLSIKATQMEPVKVAYMSSLLLYTGSYNPNKA